jgi:hypothetical protein
MEQSSPHVIPALARGLHTFLIRSAHQIAQAQQALAPRKFVQRASLHQVIKGTGRRCRSERRNLS